MTKEKDQFRSWFVWTKNRGKADLVYFISEKNDHDYTQVGDYKTVNKVYTTSTGQEILKFEK
jgi:hypothetical protein